MDQRSVVCLSDRASIVRAGYVSALHIAPAVNLSDRASIVRAGYVSALHTGILDGILLVVKKAEARYGGTEIQLPGNCLSTQACHRFYSQTTPTKVLKCNLSLQNESV